MAILYLPIKVSDYSLLTLVINLDKGVAIVNYNSRHTELQFSNHFDSWVVNYDDWPQQCPVVMKVAN